MSAYHRAWREANPERFRESQRAYREAHREKVREKNRAYREAHREELRERARARREANPEYQRAYNEANREEHREYQRAYREANPEKVRERARAYYERKPEIGRAASHRHRARQRGAAGTHTAADVIAQVERQKHRCFYCRKKLRGEYHVEHVIPLALGGSNGPENLVIACPACNLSKGAKHPADFAGILF